MNQIPTPEKQKLLVQHFLKHSGPNFWEEGEEIFLIPSTWFQCWGEYVNFENKPDASTTQPPGKINTAELCLSNSSSDSAVEIAELKPNLFEKVDYELVPGKVWTYLASWYGIEGLPISRRVILIGRNQQPFVPVYPMLDEKEESDEKLEKLVTDPGVTGLDNIGNTCYMNSALQCLSQIEPLTNFFLSGDYEKQLNEENPIGTGGVLAKAYAQLLHQLWSGKRTSYRPINFKKNLIQFATQFAGMSQQDSQEFLSFLLDSLHEDLNRVKKKKYLELPDYENQPDEFVAEESWKNHKVRNDSLLVDLFQGLYKSTLRCPECHRISVKFDPIMYLTLNLPVSEEKVLHLTMVPLDGMVPIKYGVKLSKSALSLQMKQDFAKLAQISLKTLVFAEIVGGKLHRVLGDNIRVEDLSINRDIFVYEIAESSSETKEMLRQVVVPFQQRVMKPINSRSRTQPHHQLFQPLGRPVLIKVSRNGKRRHLLEKTLPLIKNCCPQPNTALLSEGEEQNMISIRIANKDGICYQFLEDDEDTYVLSNTDSIVVEWDLLALKNFDSEKASSNTLHQSIIAENGPSKVTLAQCLQSFSSPETLEKGNEWYCNKCQKHQLAEKTLTIWRLPEYLIIHLKRFSHVNMIWREKLANPVDFPKQGLDLSPFVAKQDIPPIYDLIATSIHSGSLYYGHYTAIAKNFKDQNWYFYNDQDVKRVSPNLANPQEGYLLFYKRRSQQN